MRKFHVKGRKRTAPFSFRFFQTFSRTDRERQETPSKNTRAYRGVPYATNRNYVTIEWLWKKGCKKLKKRMRSAIIALVALDSQSKPPVPRD